MAGHGAAEGDELAPGKIELLVFVCSDRLLELQDQKATIVQKVGEVGQVNVAFALPQELVGKRKICAANAIRQLHQIFRASSDQDLHKMLHSIVLLNVWITLHLAVAKLICTCKNEIFKQLRARQTRQA